MQQINSIIMINHNINTCIVIYNFINCTIFNIYTALGESLTLLEWSVVDPFTPAVF